MKQLPCSSRTARRKISPRHSPRSTAGNILRQRRNSRAAQRREYSSGRRQQLHCPGRRHQRYAGSRRRNLSRRIYHGCLCRQHPCPIQHRHVHRCTGGWRSGSILRRPGRVGRKRLRCAFGSRHFLQRLHRRSFRSQQCIGSAPVYPSGLSLYPKEAPRLSFMKESRGAFGRERRMLFPHRPILFKGIHNLFSPAALSTATPPPARRS